MFRKIAIVLALVFWSTMAFGQTTVYLTTTGQCPWTVPAGVTSLTLVRTLGAGGSGSIGAGTALGGAGGGAYAADGPFAVSPGASIPCNLGLPGAAKTATGPVAGNDGGDTVFFQTTLGACTLGSCVGAAGGKAGPATSTGGAGGLASASIGTAKFNGGSGAAGTGNGGGSGGGAGPNGAGGNGSSGTGGTGDNGTGGAGGSSPGNGTEWGDSVHGSGGGGSSSSNTTGNGAGNYGGASGTVKRTGSGTTKIAAGGLISITYTSGPAATQKSHGYILGKGPFPSFGRHRARAETNLAFN